MISGLNEIARSWADIFFPMVLQSSLFLGLILLLLHLFRKRDAYFLRMLTIIGIIKLLIPPFLVSDRLNQTVVGFVGWLPAINTSAESGAKINDPFSAAAVLFLIWLSLALLFLLAVIIRHVGLERQLRKLNLTKDFPFEHNLNQNIKIFESDKIHSPFVTGILRHKIILPAGWRKWNVRTLRSIIAHETAHIRYGDHWINILKVIALSVHFFNPLAWILIRKSNCYSEIMCDDYAINSNKINRHAYVRILVHVAELSGRARMAVSTLNFSKAHQLIKNRINFQLNQKEGTMPQRSKTFNYFIVTALLAVTVLFSWQCSGDKDSTQQTQTTQPQATAQSEIMEFFQVDVKPELVEKAAPIYPDAARKDGIEGMVIVTVTVATDGSVEAAEIFKSAAPELNEAALKAARKLEFEPAEHQGKQVKVKMNVPFNFRLK